MADLATLRISVDSRDVKKAQDDLRSIGYTASQTENATNKMSNAFGALKGVLGGLSLALVVREFVQMADSVALLEARIKAVTPAGADFVNTQKQLVDIAKENMVAIDAIASLYTKLAKPIRALGGDTQTTLNITSAFTKALKIGGASAQEASSAILQFGQAMASGVLRGDEFNSIAEASPRILQAIADGSGIAAGSLRKLAADGELTAGVIGGALLSQMVLLEAEAMRIPQTVDGAFTNFKTDLALVASEINKNVGLTGALISVFATLSSTVGALGSIAASSIGTVSQFMRENAEIVTIATYAVTSLAGAMLSLAVAARVAAIITMLSGTITALVSATLAARLGFVAMSATMGIMPAIFFAVRTAAIALYASLGPLGWAMAAVGAAAAFMATRYVSAKQKMGEAQKQTAEYTKELGALEARIKAVGSGDAGKVKALDNVEQLAEYRKSLQGRYKDENQINTLVAARGRLQQVELKQAEALQRASAVVAKPKTGGPKGPSEAEQAAKAAAKAREDMQKNITDLETQLELIKAGTTAEEARTRVQLARQGASAEQITEILNLTKQLSAEEKKAADLKAASDNNKAAEQNLALIRQEIALLDQGYSIAEASLRLQLAKTGVTQEQINQIVAETAALDARKKVIEDGIKAVEDTKKAAEDAQKAFDNLKIDINFDAIFGDMGKAMGGVVSAFDQMADRQEKYNDLVKLGFKDEKTRAAAQQRNARLEINSYGNLAASAKGLFKEKSAGYKVMQAAETAFRAFEFAMSLKAIAMKGAEATATVAAAGTETAANTASGASKIFSQLGMWAFPVVAAMIAVMASLGGRGGSVSQPSIPSAEDMQAQQGAGSVLGDATAKSDSINRALEIMSANSNTDLEYSNQMLLSLRSIQNNMANLSNNVAKQISVSGGMFDTSGQRLGKTGSSGVFGMFASSTTRELQDLGINIVSSSIAEIIAGGISGNTYQVVEQVKKKSGFFGIGGGTKTTYQTTTGSIDQDVQNSITGVITSLRQGLIDGAAVIGLDGAQAILDSFQVSIGKISLSGLTGQEIEEQLNAIFSKVGDQMAGALLPALTSMQQIGEGLFETFARVAREYQVVDVALRSIGKEFGAVGVASIEARSALVQMFDSLDQFVEQTNYFRDNFLTEAEQIAPVAKAVADELQRLGLASIATIEQFKNTVLSLDLTSTAGQETYAALLQLAPAFKKVADYQAEIAKLQLEGGQAGVEAGNISAESAKAALEIQQKRVALEIQLLEAQGRSSEALAIRRTLELNAMDETLRGLQQQIYTAQDAKAASDAATQAAKIAADEATKIATQRTNLEIQLMEALGNSTEALAAKRSLELAALDGSLQGLQQQIYAAQDAKEANDAAAIASKAAADAAQEAANNALALSAQRTNLEIELMDALGNSSQALAARRSLELAAMDESLRGLQQQIFAAQDAKVASEEAAQATKAAAEEIAQMEKAAAENAISLAEQRTRLEIGLMEALGNASGALAAKRELELAATDEALRGLQKQIYAAEDAAKAAAELADAQSYAIALAQQRYNLEIELMEAVGNATGALAARRALELAGIDETLRGLQSQIFAAQDAKIASDAAAEASKIAAETAKAIADEIAQAEKAAADKVLALATQRTNLEIELMEALGYSSEALAAKRSLELAAMDETLRSLQQQIYAAQDAKIAREEALKAAEEAAQAEKLIQDELLKAAIMAAENAAKLAEQRTNLEIELMEALGNSAQALAAKRAIELRNMDESLRGIQEQIYAAQDAKIANDEATQAAQKYQDTLSNVTKTVLDEINRLRGINIATSSALLKSQFATLTAQARTGNLNALGKLPELSRSIEEATLGTASSAIEVARIRAWLANSLSETLAQQNPSGGMIEPIGASLTFDGNNSISAGNQQTAGEISEMSNALYTALYQIAKNTGKTSDQLNRWDGDGLPEVRDYTA